MTNPIFVMISRFMKEFPEHVVSMSDIDHNYSAIMPNPYHIEGSIWTHTMMVLNEAVRRGYDDTIQATALCHDIGKAYSRGEREKDGKMRVSFNGHEGIAFYHTIDVLDRLFPEKPATWKNSGRTFGCYALDAVQILPWKERQVS